MTCSRCGRMAMTPGRSKIGGRRVRGRGIAVLLALVITGVVWCLVPAAGMAAECRFILGFKTLHDLIPATVGNCLADERHDLATGDALQPTSGANGRGGLLVWRRSDNVTA